MSIEVGQSLPKATFRVMTADGIVTKTTDEIFAGKKVALFAVPGAFTGTCWVFGRRPASWVIRTLAGSLRSSGGWMV